MPKIMRFRENHKLRTMPQQHCVCEYTTWEAGEGTQLCLHLVTDAGARHAVQINLAAAIALKDLLTTTFPSMADRKPFDPRQN
ncbi:MAG: hypothetical protein WCI73_19535 [Phycisphaerae bacterium]